mgnify:CR=1 FL=1
MDSQDENPAVPQGQGITIDSRSDIQLVKHATEEGWDIPAGARREIMARLIAQAMSDNPRVAAAAVRSIVACDGINVARERMAVKHGPTSVTQVNVNALPPEALAALAAAHRQLAEQAKLG